MYGSMYQVSIPSVDGLEGCAAVYSPLSAEPRFLAIAVDENRMLVRGRYFVINLYGGSRSPGLISNAFLCRTC